MDVVLALIAGILIGRLLNSVTSRLRTVGLLRVVTSDEDGPYLFLELSRNVGDISREKYITLEINNQYVDSQK